MKKCLQVKPTTKQKSVNNWKALRGTVRSIQKSNNQQEDPLSIKSWVARNVSQFTFHPLTKARLLALVIVSDS